MLLHPTSETPTDIRRQNRFTVLNLLRAHGTLSKSDLARLTELTSPTISSILDDLLGEGLVRLADGAEARSAQETLRGRPATQYSLHYEGWIAVGIQIASNSVTGVVMQLDGTVLKSKRIPAASDLPAEAVLELTTTLLSELLAESEGMKLLGIGFALEGIVDVNAGQSQSMPYRALWENVPVAEYFSQRFNAPVLVDWRVYAAALAEASYGAARGVPDFVYVNVDTGVAAASVASGTLIRSGQTPAGSTGDLSHIAISGSTRLCYCGSVGCIQTELTAPALLNQLEEMVRLSHSHGLGTFWQTHPLSFDSLLEAGRQGDTLALQLRHRLAQNLVHVIRNAALLFSANRVVLGGPVVQFAGDEAAEAARLAVQRLALMHRLYGATQVVTSRLKPDSATVGAATLIVQAIMDGRIIAPSFVTKS